MELSLLLAIIVGAVFLFTPGGLMLRSANLRWSYAIALGPCLSLFCYQLTVIVYEALGVFCTAVTVVLPTVSLSLALFLLRILYQFGAFRNRPKAFPSHKVARRNFRLNSRPTPRLNLRPNSRRLPTSDTGAFVLYAVVGSMVTSIVFLNQLQTPDAFTQDFDNVHHLYQIRAFIESGNWSPLHVSAYVLPDEQRYDPLEGATSFYPSIYAMIGALLVSSLGAPVTLAANAALFLFTALVWPLGMCALLTALFGKGSEVVRWGALFVMGFVVFPWGLYTFGPLFPNMSGIALIPATAWFFMKVFRPGQSRFRRGLMALFFIMAVITLALAHPNAVFSLGVFLVPYCVTLVASTVMRRGRGSRPGRAVLATAASVAFLIVVMLIWYVAYNLPALSGIVGFTWDYYIVLPEALFNVFMFSVEGRALQPLLGIAVAVGIVATFVKRRYRWLSCSYFIMVVFYIASVSGGGSATHFLTGFWYNDPYRIAAMTVLCAVPLAAYGFSCITQWASTTIALFAEKKWRRKGVHPRVRASQTSANAFVGPHAFVTTMLVLGIAVIIYAPCLTVTPDEKEATVGLPIITHSIGEKFALTDGGVYTEAEAAFVSKVAQFLGEGDVIVNIPFDGSAFLYPVMGLDTMYRYNSSIFEGETPESKLIRTSLNTIADNEAVQATADALGLTHVLMLGSIAETDSMDQLTYLPEQWSGVFAIDETTPGFELLLQDGNMKLFRIL